MFTAMDVLNVQFIEKPLDELWAMISPLYMVDESQWLNQLLPLATPSENEKKKILEKTTQLIKAIRADKKSIQMIDALLLEYSLDTQEGILLMCLAEALMRIPDPDTADAFIKDRLSLADWKSHLKSSDSVFVNASTWGLMLTGKVVGFSDNGNTTPVQALNCVIKKFSEPVIRQIMNRAMKIMGHQFVLGQTMIEAQKNGQLMRAKGYTYSFDMLGESALTSEDANKYFVDYMSAIDIMEKEIQSDRRTCESSLSIKLSALHPRYDVGNKKRIMTELYSTLETLIIRAREKDVGITIDAEEMDRLELSLELFEKLYTSCAAQGWGKLGLVVQAYSKRALPVLVWLAALAKKQESQIPVRLVKGAYWDNEIKLSQQGGYERYPVYTRKEGSDVSYLACARFLLSQHVQNYLFPQFASHNAHTVTAVTVMASHHHFEFQKLHGMGDALFHHLMGMYRHPVRIYAPVGHHKDLLPYLVRRLLENGANSSFVHRLVDASCPAHLLSRHPVETLLANDTLYNASIPLPPDMYKRRKNSYGVNVNITSESASFNTKVNYWMQQTWQGISIIHGQSDFREQRNDVSAISVVSPYDRTLNIGQLVLADEEQAREAINQAKKAFLYWKNETKENRANMLCHFADLLEENLEEFVALCHKEAGKTIHDSIDEVREAVDFCRYYADQMRHLSSKKVIGFDHVNRVISQKGCGVFVCISPWNFPLAIFLGQITAALVTGNTVVAKPAEQTSLIAMRAIELMFDAGFPSGVIQLILGTEIGQVLISHPSIAGVAFTGSMSTAHKINSVLAERKGSPIPFIAETGGQNTMIVDSTALPEQVVRDVIRSAFVSAGQRCSALRVLYLQQEVADRIINLIRGAMKELSVGLPHLYSTDIGPVIDEKAKSQLLEHIDEMNQSQTFIATLPLPEMCKKGHFISPYAFEIDSIHCLKKEHFGPILHIIRYQANELANVIKDINSTGYGLTMGIHSRNETTYRWIEQHAQVGNCYINRDQVGAVVGVQPFGGQGLSGTGPKAGGPHYLHRFMKTEFSIVSDR